MDSTVVWIIVAILVALALVALLVWLSRRRAPTQKTKQADSLRQDAQEREVEVRRRQAEAAEVDARARQAQAEADAKAAQAEQLAATAQEREAAATTSREDLDDQYRTADEIDPRTGERTD